MASPEREPVRCLYRDALKIVLERRLRVFPVVEYGEEPRLKDWKRVATIKEPVIDVWFHGQYWGSNYGIVSDGLVVIRIENWGDDDAQSVRTELETKRGPIPRTFTLQGGNGDLLIVLRNSESRLPDQKVHLPPRTTIWADGGFFNGPGSLDASGKRCTVLDDSDIEEAPRWLKDLLRMGPKGVRHVG